MKATWILADGREITTDVKPGLNLIEAAVAANVPGVIGECGSLSCATCHVLVANAWASTTGAPSAFEDAMLDATEADRTDHSGLSCQITMSAALDGIVLHVPQVWYPAFHLFPNIPAEGTGISHRRGISDQFNAANPASSVPSITCTTADFTISGGDRMMLFPDTRTIAPAL